jgi:hypothetical protein
MYMTSVGVPSVVYETVKNLRQARGNRLGAMQRKFPQLGIILLYLLAINELLVFPLLGAGTATLKGVLSLQGFLFACLCGAHMLVLRIIQELWQSSGGVFNVDEVLEQMVTGLEDELEMRSIQAQAYTWHAAAASSGSSSSSSSSADRLPPGDAAANASSERNGSTAADELRAAMMHRTDFSRVSSEPSSMSAYKAATGSGRDYDGRVPIWNDAGVPPSLVTKRKASKRRGVLSFFGIGRRTRSKPRAKRDE